MYCTHCGKSVKGDAQFCPYCGNKIGTKFFCSNCGKELEEIIKYCPYCGTKTIYNSNLQSIKNKIVEKISVFRREINVTQSSVDKQSAENINVAENTKQSLLSANFLQEPAGFAGLRFGESLDNIQSAYKTKLVGFQSGTAAYHIWVPEANACLLFTGPIVVRGIFLDNKLIGVIIPFDKEDFQKRLNGFEKNLGGLKKFGPQMYGWSGSSTIIFIQELNGKGIISIAGSSKEIFQSI